LALPESEWPGGSFVLGRYCTRVPSVIEYPNALAELQQQGLVCNYFNGGAFGFARGVNVHIWAWIAADDPTIHAQLQPCVRKIPPPAERNMSQAAATVWQKEFPGPAWIMPLSHWAFELDFGSKSWLPTLIRSIGIDPKTLASRSDASPIEFHISEQSHLPRFVQTLLENLTSSDFMLAFPSHPTLCTIHHHKQLWWTSSDEPLIERISGYSPI
jgi:hypothetical protein